MGHFRLSRVTGCVAVCLLAVAACSQPTEPTATQTKETTPMATPLDNTQRHQLPSHAIGEDFVVDVYAPPDITDPVPVVYLTDGNMMFPMVLSTLRLLQFGNELPPLILVGIGYADSANSMALRNRDLTPTNDTAFVERAATAGPPILPHAQPGGADAYLDFIRDHVKPLIEQTYPAKPGDDTLMGESLGGLFTLHALFTRPHEYTRYVAGSPSIWWDDTVLFKTEAAYAQANQDLNATLFISIGSLEQPVEAESFGMVTNMHKMADTLTARDYPSLNLTRYEFDGETHLSVIPATFSRGLRAVFAPSDQQQ